MSKAPENKPPEPFSALSFEVPDDTETLSLSDSDPDLSDEAEIAYVSVEEEDDDEPDTRETVRHASCVQPFALKGTNSGFSLRSDSIFGGLLDVQMCSSLSQHDTKGMEVVTTSSASESPNPDFFVQEGRTAESQNKRASGRTNRKRPAPGPPLPDYLAHPERWTKYRLKDVPDTSDRENRNIALAFLTQLKQQKEAKELSSTLSYNQDSSSSAEGRILFKKPQKKCQQGDEKSETSSGQSHMAVSWDDDGGEDTEAIGEEAKTEDVGFHGGKKRSRKNIRLKADEKEEEM